MTKGSSTDVTMQDNSQAEVSGDVVSEAEVEVTSSLSELNIAMACVLKGNYDRLMRCFEDEEDKYFPVINEVIHEVDGDNGKTPLEMACILGRIEILKELITRGVDVNTVTKSGYTALHHAACWGKIDVLKLLVENGATLDTQTRHGERARDSANRYNQSECIDFLDWADARQALLDAVTLMKETLQDPEKLQGRLSREDKTVSMNACNDKLDYINNNSTEATTQDFILQKQVLDELLAPIMAKLTEPVDVELGIRSKRSRKSMTAI